MSLFGKKNPKKHVEHHCVKLFGVIQFCLCVYRGKWEITGKWNRNDKRQAQKRKGLSVNSGNQMGIFY